MKLLQDSVLAFLSAVGLTTCVWLLAGAILSREKRRNPMLRLVLPLRGEAPAMEADFRELLRLRRELPGARIVLEDCGLAPERREIAEYLCEKYEDVQLQTAVPEETSAQ